ncbi:hypothetical protein NHX12_027147 [Muraenolepis orangiensis]|uniref:Complement component C9 n=1 Tax=Muraenolepis orangiensis TaxID=630683 RepID=A0A9Q0ILM0_9TELE|nr:hypothetical protein NHX12_027147 [Muraenolepis orangiensis]
MRGINILGSSPGQNPFFNDFFNGVCNQMWDPTQRGNIRLPWNVASLNYETTVEETISREIYKSSDSLINEILTEKKRGVDGGMSFEVGAKEVKGKLGVDVGYETTDMVKEIMEYTKTKSMQFIRVQGRLQFASYRMRPRDLRVADGFLADVRHLPLEYEKSAYFDFMEMYGTHYTRHGKLGGEYQLVYALNQNVVTNKQVTQTGLKKCLSVDVKAGISGNIKGVDLDLSGHVKPHGCDDLVKTKTVFVGMSGGDGDTAAALKAKVKKDGMMDSEIYQRWAASVIQNPAVIFSEPEPIYTVIPLDMPDVNVRVANLKRGLADYVAEYNLCKCQPCQNGGTLVLMDGKCVCLCDPLYKGLACQTTKPNQAGITVVAPPAVQEGNWGCWSSWSTCRSLRHSRVRTCKPRGDTCRGTDSEDQDC